MRFLLNKKVFGLYFGLLVALTLTRTVMAQQDPQLSQFYAAPLFINPAMAGGSMMPRVMANYRNQWPNLSANFSTALFSADYYVERFNSGFGLTLMNDSQGFGRIATNEVALQYAFNIKLNETNALRLGLQGSFVNLGIDTQGLTFGDMFDQTPGNRGFNRPSNDPLSKPIANINYGDVGAGLFYYSPRYWLGAAGHHLAAQRIGSTNTTNSAAIPRKVSVHGGFNFPLGSTIVTRHRRAAYEDHEITMTVAANYKRQGAAQQMDMGTYLTIEPMTLGLWYRGVPILPRTNDAVVALVGFRQDKFSVGYSYDITVSGLGVGTGGAHEVSLRYEFEPADRYEKMRLKRRKQELSCPKF